MKYIVFLLCMFCFQVNARDIAKSDGITVNSMIPYKEAGGDCGCYYYHKEIDENNFVMYWPLLVPGKSELVIKINDNLTSFNYVTEKTDPITKAHTFHFENNVYKFLGTTTSEFSVCAPDYIECEQWGVSGTATLSTASDTLSFPIIGVCGC